MVAGVATDELEFQLLNIWLFWRGHGDVGTETHHILHTIKTGTDWPVILLIALIELMTRLRRSAGVAAGFDAGIHFGE